MRVGRFPVRVVATAVVSAVCAVVGAQSADSAPVATVPKKSVSASAAIDLPRDAFPGAVRASTSPSASPSPPPASLTPGSVSWPPANECAVAVVDADALTSEVSLARTAVVAVHGSARPVPIASIAKVMTAYVILADHPLTGASQGPSITVTAADADRYTAAVDAGQAAVEVRAGERITEREALEALLLASANNVAVLLADWDAGSVPKFLSRMNATAARLGLRSTHYADPAGLDQNTVSTAADQVRLALNALRTPAFAAIVAMPSARLPVAGVVENHDAMLGADGIVGVKTGLTNAAGGAMVVAARQTVNGRGVLIVGSVLGVYGEPSTRFGRALNAGDQLVSGVGRSLRQHLR